MRLLPLLALLALPAHAEETVSASATDTGAPAPAPAAAAAPVATSEHPVDALPSSNRLSGAKFAVLYDSAKTGSWDTRVPVSSAFYDVEWDDQYTKGAPGLAAEYLYRKVGKLGFSAGFAYEFPRTADNYDVHVNGIDAGNRKMKERKLSVFLPYLTANLSASEELFFYVGANYSAPSYTTPGIDSLSGAIGLQFGAGLALWKGLEADVGYQQLRFKYDSGVPALGSATYSLSGLLVRLGYRL